MNQLPHQFWKEKILKLFLITLSNSIANQIKRLEIKRIFLGTNK